VSNVALCERGFPPTSATVEGARRRRQSTVVIQGHGTRGDRTEFHSFGATRASQLLPRGARVVGWLDADGYRRVLDTPQPTPEWLASEAVRLR
jgi:hypothetical protein